MKLRCRSTRVAVATAVLIGLSGASAVAQSMSVERRLLLDPAAIGRDPLLLGDPALPASPQASVPADAQPNAGLWAPAVVVAPDLGTGVPAGPPSPDLSSALGQPAVQPSAATGALDPHLDIGRFSVGVETETKFKPRTPFAGEANATGYDTTFDPKRTHPALPFIGLSAKSMLP